MTFKVKNILEVITKDTERERERLNTLNVGFTNPFIAENTQGHLQMALLLGQPAMGVSVNRPASAPMVLIPRNHIENPSSTCSFAGPVSHVFVACFCGEKNFSV